MAMQEWNAVISVKEGGFKRALKVFGDFGEVKRTEFYNILTMRAGDIQGMLDALREKMEQEPGFLEFLSRLIPVSNTFIFNSSEEFESKARETVEAWAPRLAGKRFHVRIHRRGFKGRFSSPEEERNLDTFILESLEKSGSAGEIAFDDPDAVIAVETIGTRAGLSLFAREDMKRYPFIRVE